MKQWSKPGIWALKGLRRGASVWSSWSWLAQVETEVASEFLFLFSELSIGRLVPSLCLRRMGLAGWLSPHWDESQIARLLPCFSELELSPWFLLVHRERALWDSLQDIHRLGKCITHCGLFLPNCRASFQHSACCHYILSMDWFSLNPWLIAFCSNAHRADYLSLSASAPILLTFFVSVWMWEK